MKSWILSRNSNETLYFLAENSSDFFYQLGFAIISFAMYKLNQENSLFLDYYKVKLLKLVTRVIKPIIITSIMGILFYRKLKLQSSFYGIFENLIIIYFFIDFFFKFKSGSLQSLHKYIRLLKYITIANLVTIFLSIIYRDIFQWREQREEVLRRSIFRMFSGESYTISRLDYEWAGFYSLIL